MAYLHPIDRGRERMMAANDGPGQGAADVAASINLLVELLVKPIEL